ncbi:glycosyltransferase family 4 protein [Georgenia sp. SUBG003]|uniref:glycosyltransferase family 4 protein n=1 Tax=Georgenia sp. SUBG003 TaxID=1497974 RepID=UPI0004D6CC71|nr:hypothetical protein DA06_02610 [Georgenia sp. SUBG003]
MRILLVTHHYTPEASAPQQRWEALVARFVAAGHEVAVLAPPPHYPGGRLHTRDPRVRPGAVSRGRHGEMVHRVAFREHGQGLSSRAFDQLVSATDAVRVALTRFRGRHRPDLVVATAPAIPAVPSGLVIGAALKVPVVLEMRDAWPDLLRFRQEWDTTTPGLGGLPLTRAGAWMLSFALTGLQRHAAAVVTTTESFADVLSARGVQHVRTIRNGAHGCSLPRARVVDRPGELRVLYLGTVGRLQGLGTAVAAAARARAAGTPVRLRIIGEGAGANGLRAQARHAGASVEVLPSVPAAEVAAHHDWADTVLVSLRDLEPLRWCVPSKLYELLAAGRHVTGVVDGESADIIRSTGAGHVVPPGDADALAQLWARLHADRSLLDVGPEGRRWAAVHASDDQLAKDYLEVLQEVVRA